MVFVPATAPQDRVRVRVTARKARFWEAEVVQVISPSPHRRQPPCPVALRCGGCTWQHIDYAEQIRQKEKILRDSLRGLKDFAELPFLAAPSEFHYRNRIQLQVQDGRFGFFAQRSRRLVEIKECWIAETDLNARLRQLTEADLRGVQRLELAITEDDQVRQWSAQRDPSLALFSQVNRAQNEVLRRLVAQLAQELQSKPAWIMDLYSGSGNLAEPLQSAFPGVPLTAVELSKASVQRGRQRFPKMQWKDGDVAEVLAHLSPRSGPGLIVLDPPRPGCEREVLSQIERHSPAGIVYVSCNPSTFARDVQRLQEKGRFKLLKVQGLDMFPQTEHVELVASLCAVT